MLCGLVAQWLGRWTRVQQVTAMHGFNSQPRHYRARTLGKLFTPMCLCSPSSIIWYLARALMQNAPLCGSGMGSNEQGEYCSSVFCSDLDRMNRDINYLLLLFFTFYWPKWPCVTDFRGLSTYGLNGHREGDEHPTYAAEGHGQLYLFKNILHQ